jgi:hypothetical protein
MGWTNESSRDSTALSATLCSVSSTANPLNITSGSNRTGKRSKFNLAVVVTVSGVSNRAGNSISIGVSATQTSRHFGKADSRPF